MYDTLEAHDATVRALLESAGVTFDEYGQAIWQDQTTDPMERSEYSIGKGKDFFYMDYLLLPLGYVALELVIDAGNYTATQAYEIVPDASAPDVAYGMGCQALDWFADNGIYRVPGRAARNRFMRDVRTAVASRQREDA